MVLKFNKDRVANILLVIFLVLLSFSKIIMFRPIFYPAALCAVAAICLGNETLRLGISLLLIPNIRIVDTLNFTFMINLLLLLPLFAYVLERRKINFTALAHVSILVAWELLHVLAFASFGKIAPNVGAIIILYYVECILTDRNVHIDFADISRKFAFGCIFSCFTFLVRQSRISSVTEYLNTWRLSAFAGDPNYYALYLCLAISMMFIIADGHKVRDYVYIFVLMGITLLTSSKMALITLIVMLLFFAGKSLYGIFARKNRFARRVVIAGTFVAAIFSSKIAELISNTLERIQEKNGDTVDIDTITSNRVMILNFYNNELFTNPALLLFGYGLQYNETPAYAEFAYISHNTFLDLVLSWGLIGTILFAFIMYQILAAMKKNRTEKLTFSHFIPLIIALITFLALSCLSATMFWWVMCAILLPLKGLKYNEKTVRIGNSTGVQRRKIHFSLRPIPH